MLQFQKRRGREKIPEFSCFQCLVKPGAKESVGQEKGEGRQLHVRRVFDSEIPSFQSKPQAEKKGNATGKWGELKVILDHISNAVNGWRRG